MPPSARLAFVAGLILGTPSLAAPPAVNIPSPKGGLLNVQVRPFKAGDHYSFISRTSSYELQGRETGGRSGGQSSRVGFDLEVLAVDAATGQLVLRYTPTEMKFEDARQPGIQKLMRAFVDVPLEFRTTIGLHPGEALNGPEVRAAVTANLKRLKGSAELQEVLDKLFDDLMATPDGLAAWMAADVTDLAGMFEPQVPNEPLTLPSTQHRLDDGSVLVRDGTVKVISVDDSRCRVTFARWSRMKIAAKGYTEELSTQATVATDGLAVTLKQRQFKAGADGYVFEENETITRLSAAPGCL